MGFIGHEQNEIGTLLLGKKAIGSEGYVVKLNPNGYLARLRA